MPDNVGPVYEVTHLVDRDVVDEFDSWLGHHVEQMLELPGINRASTFTADDELGRPRRVTLYYFDSDRDLDEYVEGPAATMRRQAEERFPNRFEVSRRILYETDIVDGEVETAEQCLNCGTPLGGQYCGQCGQRARSRLISIWELTREAFGDLLELDSRLWRTLIPLIIRPGQLTRDYLEGRRARFMPPFRTYLVLSIVFFLVAFFDPRESFSILFEPTPPEAEEASETAQSADEIRAEVMEDLVESGVLLPEQAAEIEEEVGSAIDQDGGLNISLTDGEVTTENECDDVDIEDAPDWLKARLTPERLTAVCERIVADDGRTFLSRLLDNVPRGAVHPAAIDGLRPQDSLSALEALLRRTPPVHRAFSRLRLPDPDPAGTVQPAVGGPVDSGCDLGHHRYRRLVLRAHLCLQGHAAGL